MESHPKESHTAESHPMPKNYSNLSLFLVACIIILLYLIVFGILLQYCWNYSVHEMFNLPEMTFVQAVALLVLLRLLLHPLMGKSESVIMVTQPKA